MSYLRKKSKKWKVRSQMRPKFIVNRESMVPSPPLNVGNEVRLPKKKGEETKGCQKKIRKLDVQ